MSEANKLRDYFYGWQCRIRQHAVRKADGRPSEGMRASISDENGDKALGAVITGLVKRNAAEITSEFRHIVKKTHDPNLRQQAAIKLLSSVYYQYPKEFEDSLTATFAIDSELAGLLVASGDCELHFEQHQQQFRLACSVKNLTSKSDAYQMTYWHNRMFNPSMPAEITVLGFTPNWKNSSATPAIT